MNEDVAVEGNETDIGVRRHELDALHDGVFDSLQLFLSHTEIDQEEESWCRPLLRGSLRIR